MMWFWIIGVIITYPLMLVIDYLEKGFLTLANVIEDVGLSLVWPFFWIVYLTLLVASWHKKGKNIVLARKESDE